MTSPAAPETAKLCDLTPKQVGRAFDALLAEGASLRVAGTAKRNPKAFVRRYHPVHLVEFYNTRFFISEPRQIPILRFFVAYVVQPAARGGQFNISARIFYKDLSLVWRVASHLIANDDEFWIGKGDVESRVVGGYELLESIEATTDLPLEIQSALEEANRNCKNVRTDERVLHSVLRNAPTGRVEPYKDFSGPRAMAFAKTSNRINKGRSIARFKRRNEPSSLVVAKGFEPDFRGGVVERGVSKSTLYHGKIRRFRILSRNKKVQYLFFRGPRHVWIAPPQTCETNLSSYGVRLITVRADDDLFVPGYEYHYFDPEVDPDEHFSQIPEGFAGEASEYNNDRADASAWLDKIPMIKEFRRKVR